MARLTATELKAKDPKAYQKMREQHRPSERKYRSRNRSETNYRSRIIKREDRAVLKALKKTNPKLWLEKTAATREYLRKYNKQNKETLRKKAKKYYQIERMKNIEAFRKKANIRARRYRGSHRDKLRLYYHKRHREIRNLALEAYGGPICKCSHPKFPKGICGETTWEFLSIDHVTDAYGSTLEHRKKMRAASLYHWLKKNNYPSGFQVLCHNCNQAKGFYGSCPHQQKKI